MKRLSQSILQLMIVAGCIGVATVIGVMFRRIGFAEANIIIIYQFAVLLIARILKGYCYGLLASITATFAFNFFFTAPYYSFAVYDASYIITFGVMIATSVATIALTSRVKESAIKAKEKESEMKALYELTNRLLECNSLEEMLIITTNTLTSTFHCPMKIETSEVGKTKHQSVSASPQLRVEKVASEDGMAQERQMMTHQIKIRGRERTLGILTLPMFEDKIMSEAQNRLLHGMLDSLALAMDRYYSLEQQRTLREETVQERYRGNLLRAISHDLRTPLAGIIGTSEMVLDLTRTSDPRYEMIKGIYTDADWLHSVVENILSLTRLEEGRLTLHKQPEAVEEIISAAILHMEKRLPKREIVTHIPEDVLFVPMDGRLIEQVLINLLDNAFKHTEEKEEIELLVSLNSFGKEAIFTVADRGDGIKEEEIPKLFQMFYTSKANHTDAKQGIGLGLSICEAIIKAHGGTILARNRSGGGAEFIFTLPLEVMEYESLGGTDSGN